MLNYAAITTYFGEIIFRSWEFIIFNCVQIVQVYIDIVSKSKPLAIVHVDRPMVNLISIE